MKRLSCRLWISTIEFRVDGQSGDPIRRGGKVGSMGRLDEREEEGG